MSVRSIALGLIVAGSLGFGGVSAPAHAQSAERVFVDLGRWTIYDQPGSRTCTLRHRGQNGVAVAMTKTGTGRGRLALQAPTRSVFVGDVVFAFDQTEFPGRRSGDRLYTPLSNSAGIEESFRQARTLSLRQGGATLATISLKTSAAAFRLLKQCAEEGRFGIAATRFAPQTEPPAQAAARPSPPRQASRPANTAAQPRQTVSDPVPRNRGDWIKGSDYSRLRSRSWEGGEMQYTLVVSPGGRPQECVVNVSSGLREFDAVTCRNLQRRARFEPARDARGNAVIGRFSSSVRYNSP